MKRRKTRMILGVKKIGKKLHLVGLMVFGGVGDPSVWADCMMGSAPHSTSK